MDSNNNIKEFVPMINGVLVKSKIYRKTEMVFEKFQNFISTFIQENIEKNPVNLHEIWNSFETQNTLRTFIYEKKITMKKPIEQVLAEKNIRKEDAKENRENRDKEIQRKRVERQQERPKSAYFFFRNDESSLIKSEFPELDKKGVHNELQKRWKELKGSERSKSYKEIAEKVAKEKIDQVIANGIYNSNKKSEKYIKKELKIKAKIENVNKPKYIPPRQ